MRICRAAGPLVLVLVLALASCAGGAAPTPGPDAPAGPSSSPVVQVPPDGLLLGAFGFSSGPLRSFSLPRSTRLTVAVDQPDNVTAVLSSPPAADVAVYLRGALPDAGYTVTADTGEATLTFRGNGWTGSFTGAGDSSAVVLRPV